MYFQLSDISDFNMFDSTSHYAPISVKNKGKGWAGDLFSKFQFANIYSDDDFDDDDDDHDDGSFEARMNEDAGLETEASIERNAMTDSAGK